MTGTPNKPMTKLEALQLLQLQGGHAFLTPIMAQEIAAAFGLDPLTMQEIKADRGLPRAGFLCAELARKIADDLGLATGARPYDGVTDYNQLNLMCCAFIASALGLSTAARLVTDDIQSKVGLRFDRLNEKANPIWRVVWLPTDRVLETLPELTTADQAQLKAMQWAADIESGEKTPP